MDTTTATQNIFKPFLVESRLDSKNIFRVVEVTGDVTREQVEKLLESLPISFQLHKDDAHCMGSINEPLEVYVNGVIVYIYPQKHRVIACTTFDSWESANTISKMHVDNVMDAIVPGNGQLRTCVHFDPKVFSIENWPNTETTEVEVDIHVFPKGTKNESKLEAYSFGKWDVRKLLELIAGGDKKLTLEQFGEWRELIMYAVMSMRANYENPDVPEDNNVRKYYKSCWERIASAQNDEELIRALDDLRSSIKYE